MKKAHKESSSVPDPVWEGNSIRAWVPGEEPPRLESRVEELLQRAEVRVRAACDRWKEEIRTHPAKAVMLAAAGGYVCHRLHSRGLLFAGLKIFTAFTPPTLIALGLCKAAEFCKVRDAEWARSRPGSPDAEAAPADAEPPRVVVTDVS